MTAHVHEDRPEVLRRLKRAEGHLRSVVAMIETDRPCAEVAQQLHAVEAAVRNAKRMLIRDHIDHCLDSHLVEGGDPAETLREFKQITKYL